MSTTATPRTATAYTGRPTFVEPFGGGRPIPVRSVLEARWCLLLSALGVAWSYEPKTYALDTGRLYTPDLLVETADGPALIEIKPHTVALLDARVKLDALRRGLAGTADAPKLFTFTCDDPGFVHRRLTGPPVLRWDPLDGDGWVRVVRDREALRLFSTAAGRAVLAETPDAYAEHVERLAVRTAADVRGRVSHPSEALFTMALAAGEPFGAARDAYNRLPR